MFIDTLQPTTSIFIRTEYEQGEFPLVITVAFCYPSFADGYSFVIFRDMSESLIFYVVLTICVGT